jgi:hypothetical protein
MQCLWFWHHPLLHHDPLANTQQAVMLYVSRYSSASNSTHASHGINTSPDIINHPQNPSKPTFCTATFQTQTFQS